MKPVIPEKVEIKPKGWTSTIKGWRFEFEGTTYCVPRYDDVPDILSSARNGRMKLTTNGVDHFEPCVVVDRKRDFGGCGKDALKLEVGVPLIHWLHEVFARVAPDWNEI